MGYHILSNIISFSVIFVALIFASVTGAHWRNNQTSNATDNGFGNPTEAHHVFRRTLKQAPQVDLKKFREDALAAHNKYRKRHGAVPLKLNNQVNTIAQNYANTLGNNGKFEHSGNPNVGENLYYSAPNNAELAASVPVDSWYKEIKYYNFDDPESNINANVFPKIGHFSAMVWNSTTDVGFGYSGKNNRIVIVANYKPPGNVKGKFGENVFRVVA